MYDPPESDLMLHQVSFLSQQLIIERQQKSKGRLQKKVDLL